MENITLNVKRLLAEVPHGVTIVAAAKTRTSAEMRQVLESGISNIGHNFIQEDEASNNNVGDRVCWHFIGHLQRNKVKKLEREMEKHDVAKTQLEEQWADNRLYSDENKDKLKHLLEKQTNVTQKWQDIEEQWLDASEVLEGLQD